MGVGLFTLVTYVYKYFIYSNTVEPHYFELRSNSLGFTLGFTLMLSAIYNSPFFPYTSNPPRYFKLVKNRART